MYLLLLAFFSSAVVTDVTGYWIGETEDKNRLFLTFRGIDGTYASLQQKLNEGKVEQWHIQFGYWELASNEISTSIVGMHSEDGTKVLSACVSPKVTYSIDTLGNDILRYTSKKSGTTYSTKRSTVEQDNEKISNQTLEFIRDKLAKHKEVCE